MHIVMYKTGKAVQFERPFLFYLIEFKTVSYPNSRCNTCVHK
jgi:hypothetical protein